MPRQKAPFFPPLGFRQDARESPAAALRKLAGASPAAKQMESSHGLKQVLDSKIEMPSGRSPTVRTIWIVDARVETPRLVTAYPLRNRD